MSLVAQLVRIHLQCGRPGFDPWVGKTPWRRERLPTTVFWPGEFHGLYSPWDCKEPDMTKQLSLSVGNSDESDCHMIYKMTIWRFCVVSRAHHKSILQSLGNLHPPSKSLLLSSSVLNKTTCLKQMEGFDSLE